MQDPNWLRGYFGGQESNLFLYSLYQSDQLCGVAAFLRRDWPMKWQIGELTLAEFPLTRFRLLTDTLTFPSEEAAYDVLFQELAKADGCFDMLHLEEIPVDSFLWNYLNSRTLIRNSFLIYQPDAPAPHPLLRFQGSYEEYMGKFSSKHRKNLMREIKRIRDGVLGPMQFMRIERSEELAWFLDQAVEVSRKTYQWTLHQRGLSATELLRKRLQFAAAHGWMRCYLLLCGHTACAFIVGFQHNGRFLFHEIGFDPAFAKYSVGMVLQLMAIEDLFNYKRPQLLDFGDYGAYKAMLSTESYVQGRVLLFHRRAYTRFLRAGHRVCRFTDRSLSSLLDRLNLKNKLRQRMRGWNRSQ